jgi:protein SCO1/2
MPKPFSAIQRILNFGWSLSSGPSWASRNHAKMPAFDSVLPIPRIHRAHGDLIIENVHLAKGIAFALLAVGGLLLGGCGNQVTSKVTHAESSDTVSKVTFAETNNTVSSGMQANPLESTNIMRSFLARGVIRELPVGGQTVVVRHEEIPGFMPKMTMEFNVRDTNELRGLLAGDTITFHVKANEQESWIEGIHRSGTNDLTSPLPSDPPASSLLHIAQMTPGDVLPDAELLAEDGRTIKLSDFEGRALAFTFIFTRCPLPDFCPRMNQHFNRARELLLRRADGPTNWQFLSISFDPEFDKPGVLNRYAYSYRGQSADRWLFAAAPTNVMASMASQLDFRFANEGGSFLHNLRTVVLDPQRRVHRQFDGNIWKAEELAQALAEAAQSRD